MDRCAVQESWHGQGAAVPTELPRTCVTAKQRAGAASTEKPPRWAPLPSHPGKALSLGAAQNQGPTRHIPLPKGCPRSLWWAGPSSGPSEGTAQQVASACALTGLLRVRELHPKTIPASMSRSPASTQDSYQSSPRTPVAPTEFLMWAPCLPKGLTTSPFLPLKMKPANLPTHTRVELSLCFVIIGDDSRRKQFICIHGINNLIPKVKKREYTLQACKSG